MRKVLYFIPIIGIVITARDVHDGKVPEPWYTITSIYHSITIVLLAVQLLNYYK